MHSWMGDRKMAKMDRIDLPPDAERPNAFARRHGRFAVTETEVRDNAGLVTTKAVKRLDECELDRMFFDGKLGRPDGDEAKRRYAAGLWLRELHYRCGTEPNVVGGYGAGRGGRQEMTQDQADAMAEFAAAMRALRGYSEVVQRVCVWDRGCRLPATLRAGLDRLADWRGL